MLVLNLVPDDETYSSTAATLVRAFHEHSPDMRIDVVLADSDAITEWDALHEAAELVGARVVDYHLARHVDNAQHDPLFLAAAFREVFDSSI